MMEENEMKEKEELFSKAVKAGKRTYFFDVKSTKNDEKYITITESKRRFDEGLQRFFYEKHKIFLYKEDIRPTITTSPSRVTSSTLRAKATVRSTAPSTNGSTASTNKLQNTKTNWAASTCGLFCCHPSALQKLINKSVLC